mgnify:CR=1 FL=1
MANENSSLSFRPVAIYILFDKNYEPIWVGKSIRLSGRLNQHVAARRSFSYYVVVEYADLDSWVERERFWISLGRLNGWSLKNKASGGGGGGSPGYKCSLATRRRMRAAKLGRSLSKEHRAKIGAAHKGRILNSRQRAAFLLWRLCQMVCRATFGTTWIRHPGKRLSVEHKAALRKAWRKRFADGRVDCLSDVGKERIRQAALKRWRKWRRLKCRM